MRSLVYLADIDSRTIPNSAGMKEKYVKSMTVITAEVLNVGQDTFWNAQASNIALSYTIVWRRDLFKNEKYLYTCGGLREIVNIGKAKDERDILLNVKDLTNTAIEKAIKDWIADNEKDII